MAILAQGQRLQQSINDLASVIELVRAQLHNQAHMSNWILQRIDNNPLNILSRAATNNQEATKPRTASRAAARDGYQQCHPFSNPQRLEQLWDEYERGIAGRTPRYSPVQRGDCARLRICGIMLCGGSLQTTSEQEEL